MQMIMSIICIQVLREAYRPILKTIEGNIKK